MQRMRHAGEQVFLWDTPTLARAAEFGRSAADNLRGCLFHFQQAATQRMRRLRGEERHTFRRSVDILLHQDTSREEFNGTIEQLRQMFPQLRR